jgi:diguanylate cyclase (GGDEF)-like protein
MHDFVATHAPCGLVELDPAGGIVDANVTFLRWAGRELDEVMGSRLQNLLEDGTTAETEAREATDQTTGPAGTRSVTVKLLHADGTSLPVLISWDRQGDRILAALFDATRREEFETHIVQAHSLVERQHRRLNLLLRSAVAFADAMEPEILARELADVARDAYSATTSTVFLVDESAHVSLAVGSFPFQADAQGEVLSDQAMGLRSVVTFEDIARSTALAPATTEALTSAGVRGMLVAPIAHEDRQLGILAVFFDHVRAFDLEAVPLAEALTRQAGQVIARIELQNELQRAAMLDDITGLPNRRLFEEQVQRFASGDDLVGVAFIDLDGFKAVNDTLGHEVGDAVLREVARRIQLVVREQDAVARFGGDEFVAVLKVHDRAAAHAIAERIRQAVAESYDLPKGLTISASIGLAVGDVHPDPHVTDRLVRIADQAMYRAKNEGGNRVVGAGV